MSHNKMHHIHIKIVRETKIYEAHIMLTFKLQVSWKFNERWNTVNCVVNWRSMTLKPTLTFSIQSICWLQSWHCQFPSKERKHADRWLVTSLQSSDFTKSRMISTPPTKKSRSTSFWTLEIDWCLELRSKPRRC